MFASPPKICIFRTDRIGDLVLTLPTAEAVKRSMPDVRLTMCVRRYTAELAAMSPAVDDILILPGSDPDGVDAAFVKELRRCGFDAAVFAYPGPRLAFAAFRAGIPIRVGTAYRWYSFLFTHRVREHRKDARRHERDYSLSLIESIGIPTRPQPMPRLAVPDEARRGTTATFIREIREKGRHVVILHPGSGDSAKEWPSAGFGALARELKNKLPDMRILVSGIKDEREQMLEVCRSSEDAAEMLDEELSLTEFAAVCAEASLLVANSTGPLHVASALGTAVLGLYPFERPCNPRRWGPLGARAVVMTPPRIASCEACRNERCREHDLMERIPVSAVLAEAVRLLAGSGTELA